MYNYISVIFSIIIPIIILRKNLKKAENLKIFIQENKLAIMIYIIFVVGFLTRLIGIVNFPNGLNTDEASIGVEALSILRYGFDRNGHSYPVFLESWGSGQNALYMYIIMPFVKIFGLKIFSVRLPMAILGCISLVVMYKILSKTNKHNFTIIGLAFFAITPWHIMKSRYGLESNVFPEFMLYAFYFIFSGLEDKKIYKMYIGAVFLGLCSYAYGTSYYFLPIFTIILLITFLVKKEIKFKNAIIFLGIIFIISLPIILMIFINTFDFNEIHIGKVTIPRTEENRYEQLTLFSSKNIISSLLNNFKRSMKMLLLQSDGFKANALEFFGIIYVFSLPIAIIGLITSFKNKDKIYTIFNIWFLVAFVLSFVCQPNINRMNILYIPIIFYNIVGLYEIITKIEWSKSVLVLLYVISFINFEIVYFNTDFTQTYTFLSKIENVIKYTKNIDAETIYIEYAFKEPYIFILFFNEGDTKEFVDTVRYKNNFKTFNSVEEFGKYKFHLTQELEEDSNVSYVMTKQKSLDYDIDDSIWKITDIDGFCILEKRN